MLKPTHRPYGFTQVELLTVLAVSGILISLTTPAILAARQSAARSTCQNHLRQLGLGLHNYHDNYNCFPPAWTNRHWAPDLGPGLGWHVRLLPFTDQARLYDGIATYRDKLPSADFNSSLFQNRVPYLRCPSDPIGNLNPYRGNLGTTNYSLNFGDTAPPRWANSGQAQFWPGQADTPSNLRKFTGLGMGNKCIGIAFFLDGTSNTIHVGERASFTGANLWVGVRGNQYEDDVTTHCAPGNEINKGRHAFSSFHKGGAYFLFCDGGVHFLSEKIASHARADANSAPGLFQKLANPKDRFPVENFLEDF